MKVNASKRRSFYYTRVVELSHGVVVSIIIYQSNDDDNDNVGSKRPSLVSVSCLDNWIILLLSK